MKFAQREYAITTDPNYLNDQFAITAELSSKMEEYHHLAVNGKKSSVLKIRRAIEKHPNNPQLKNYLSVLYGKLENYEKMYEVNRWIVAEHPDYLFGKLNLANEYYIKQEYEKMPEILGPEMEINSLYPERDTFHLDEVVSFLKSAILYYSVLGNVAQVEIRLEMMKELAFDESDIAFAEEQRSFAILVAAKKRYEEEQKDKILVQTKPQESTGITQRPDFIHEEIVWLYENGLFIVEEKLKTILALPRETLVQDLELVLHDGIDRYGHFQKMVEESDWIEERMNFANHAIFLLAELRAKESIDSVFNLLSQSYELLNLYFGDFLTTSLWEVIYKLSNNDLELCKQFLFKPGVNTYARSIIPNMIAQVAMHQPERRDEVVVWFKDVMQFFLASTLEDNVIDSDLIAFLIGDVIDIKGTELLPEISKLYELGYVSIGVNGEYDEVVKAMSHQRDRKIELLTIFELYNSVTDSWAGYDEEAPDFGYEDLYEPYNMPVVSAPKIGRNEPCPCGSSKKYKKCCWNT